VAKEIYRLAIREGRGEEDFSVIHDYLAHTCESKPRLRVENFSPCNPVSKG